VHAETLSAGGTLAGRYRIEDLVGETARSQMWRAVDHVLNRSVGVQVLRADDRSSEAFLTAARRATVVEDPRFLRVLDAAHENDLAYVVREWASGVSLDNVLRQGPLPPTRASEVMREVAEAVAAAHRAHVQHRRLDPARIIVKHNGAVRVLGLATDQALQAPDEDLDGAAGEQADVTALGRLLYACLVARWPGGRDVGLPAAPTEHGRLLRPRQVRAGVDPAVDTVCDRILGNGARGHGATLDSAQQVARELAVLALGDDTATTFAPVDDDDETIPRGVLPVPPDPRGPPPAVHVVPPPRSATGRQTPPRPAPRRSTGGRVPAWLGAGLLVTLVAVLTFLVLRPGAGEESGAGPGGGPSGGDPSGGTQVLDVSVSDFDPLGDGAENPETAPRAADGDGGTAWTTSSYYSELPLQKAGVGLLLDLGRQQRPDSVELLLGEGPLAVELYAVPPDTPAPTTLDGLEPVESVAAAGTEVTLRPEGTPTEYLVVWLTELPEVDTGVWQGSVAEIIVRG